MTAPRIVAGRFRGRRIIVPDHGGVRPTASRMREALFSRLAPVIDGARFLDLFAGSGAIGIEALSRGASAALFVERDRISVAAIRRNLEALGVTAQARVLQGDATTMLPKDCQPFDIVFADPPYRSGLGEAALMGVYRRRLFHAETIFIVELAADESFEPPPPLALTDVRRYGAGRLVTLTAQADEI